MMIKGIKFKLVRVDGDPNGELMPDRILLERGGITAEYILTNAVDGKCNCVQKGTWEDCR